LKSPPIRPLGDGEEEYHHAVQALGTRQQLQNHDLTGFAGVLAQKTGTCFTGDAGALGGTNAAQTYRQARAQKRQSQPTKRIYETHNYVLLLIRL
jgi:hypothetical protein